LHSVAGLSFKGNQRELGNVYTIHNTIIGWKWKAEKSLSELFTPSNLKWIKPTEYLDIEDNQVYDFEELEQFLEKNKMSLERTKDSKWKIKIA